MDTCGHVGWQIKNTKETTNPNRKGRTADPPARYALRHPAEKQRKSEWGRTQQKQPQRRFVAITKDALNELVAAQRVKHASKLFVADRQQSISCTPLHTQSPLTSSCSGVGSRRNVFAVNRTVVQEQEKQLSAANLQLYALKNKEKHFHSSILEPSGSTKMRPQNRKIHSKGQPLQQTKNYNCI